MESGLMERSQFSLLPLPLRNQVRQHPTKSPNSTAKDNEPNETDPGETCSGSLYSALNPQPATLNALRPGQPHAARRAGADDEDAFPGGAAHAHFDRPVHEVRDPETLAGLVRTHSRDIVLWHEDYLSLAKSFQVTVFDEKDFLVYGRIGQ